MAMKLRASKEVVVAALVTDKEGRVLIVEPEHKEGWIFPGGSVEQGEPPSEACARAIEEELGVSIESPTRLLSVDYRGCDGEYIMFIFDCGTFDDELVKTITLPEGLLAYRFATVDEAMKLLRPNSARRLKPTLAARSGMSIAYLEHQELFS
jgi:8-oxo-dGTP pyrophosphatase MutT (NUDIX family)